MSILGKNGSLIKKYSYFSGDSNSDPRPKRLIEYLKKDNDVYILSDHSKVNDANCFKLDFVQLRFGRT